MNEACSHWKSKLINRPILTEAKVKGPGLGGRFLLLGVTLTAIDRSTFSWFEGDLGFGSAISACYRMHLTGASAITVSTSAAGGSALRTTAGIILKAMRLIELLFTRSEHEFLSAITTAQSFFF